MKLLARLFTIVLLCFRCAGHTPGAGETVQSKGAAEQLAKRAVTMPDCIGMTKLAGDSQTAFAKFSPDGKKFVVVLKRGNLQENANDYSLVLWRTDDVFSSPGPEVLVSLSSSANEESQYYSEEGIADVTWLDNETIAFLGAYAGEVHHQIYTFSIRNHSVTKLTNHSTNVLSMSFDATEKSFVYIGEAHPPVSFFDEKARHDGVAISNESFFNVILDQKGRRFVADANDQLFFVREGGAAQFLKVGGILQYPDLRPPVLSPDGRYVAQNVFVNQIPDSWKEYTDKYIQQYAHTQLSHGEYTYLQQWVVVDTSSGESRPLVNAPNAAYSEVAWSPDSQSVAIAGVYLPLDSTAGEERRIRRSQAFTVEVSVRTGRMAKITKDESMLLGWDPKTNVLEFDSRKRYSNSDAPDVEPRILFRKSNRGWERVSDGAPQALHPRIVLEESMNAPPKIVAIDMRTNAKAMVLDLNPQFSNLKFGKVEEIHWHGADGRDTQGGLYYPVDYVPGQRYPLVIQTHGWSPNRFWIDGPFTSAFAAQPLAGKGIMVLQLEMTWATLDTPQEAETELSAYEGAIEYLDKMGMIDRSRVGLIGFSRTCFHVKYALTHSKYNFAAAAVMDGLDGSYFQYILFANNYSAPTRIMETFNGGVPFGEGLKSWLERSTDFHFGKVNTPLRIFAESPVTAAGEWEWFAALRRLGKPVELVMMKDGVHILEKPYDRIVSQQGNVDWFAFWLKGEEDPDPAKAEQYGRWRKLRTLQMEQPQNASLSLKTE